MVTYFYWFFVLLLAGFSLFLLGVKFDQWKAAAITSAIIFVLGWGAYYFHFEQVFVKRWGGVMTINVPDGQHHMGATWKDDNLWIENYDPKSNTCHFTEYSKGNVLQGKVTIKNCTPLIPSDPVNHSAQP